MKPSMIAWAGLTAALGLAAPAQAGLLGHLVTLEGHFGALTQSAGTQTVTGAVEFPDGVLHPNWFSDFDLNSHQIINEWNRNTDSFYNGSEAFNGLVFTFTGVTLTGATVDPASAFSPIAIYLSANSVALNYSGVSVPPNSRSIIDLTFAGGGAVPEPASWALLIAGFGLTGAALRRRRSPTCTAA